MSQRYRSARSAWSFAVIAALMMSFLTAFPAEAATKKVVILSFSGNSIKTQKSSLNIDVVEADWQGVFLVGYGKSTKRVVAGNCRYYVRDAYDVHEVTKDQFQDEVNYFGRRQWTTEHGWQINYAMAAQISINRSGKVTRIVQLDQSGQ